MHLHLLAIFTATAMAEVIPVDVGTVPGQGDDRPRFNPSVIRAVTGDVIEFRWIHGTHDVTLSHFDTPCQPYIGDYAGFYSGMASGGVDDWNPRWRLQINTTSLDEMFFYSSLGSDCARGMVGVINPTSEDSLIAYGDAAAFSEIRSPYFEPMGGEWSPPGPYVCLPCYDIE